jgi:hypothetical protein
MGALCAREHSKALTGRQYPEVETVSFADGSGEKMKEKGLFGACFLAQIGQKTGF